MDNYVYWMVAGFILLTAELLTGTFYLAVIGIAAFAGAAAAYAELPFRVQAVIAAGVAVAGGFLAHSLRKSVPKGSGIALDIGEPVTLENWISEADGLARVKYRGALWDALVTGEPRSGEERVFYICGGTGNTLHVSRNKPV